MQPSYVHVRASSGPLAGYTLLAARLLASCSTAGGLSLLWPRLVLGGLRVDRPSAILRLEGWFLVPAGTPAIHPSTHP